MKNQTNLETRNPGKNLSRNRLLRPYSWLPGFLIIPIFFFSSCSTQQLATSPIGAAIIAQTSNSVIDKGLNAGATRIDTGNPYLHALAEGLRANEGKILTVDDVKKIAADYGDPNNPQKFKSLAVNIWSVIKDAAWNIGWAAATELAAQGIQDGATNPAPLSP